MVLPSDACRRSPPGGGGQGGRTTRQIGTWASPALRSAAVPPRLANAANSATEECGEPPNGTHPPTDRNGGTWRNGRRFWPHVPIWRGVSKAAEPVGKGTKTHHPAGAERGNGTLFSLWRKGKGAPGRLPKGPRALLGRFPGVCLGGGRQASRSGVPPFRPRPGVCLSPALQHPPDVGKGTGARRQGPTASVACLPKPSLARVPKAARYARVPAGLLAVRHPPAPWPAATAVPRVRVPVALVAATGPGRQATSRPAHWPAFPARAPAARCRPGQRVAPQAFATGQGLLLPWLLLSPSRPRPAVALCLFVPAGPRSRKPPLRNRKRPTGHRGRGTLANGNTTAVAGTPAVTRLANTLPPLLPIALRLWHPAPWDSRPFRTSQKHKTEHKRFFHATHD